MLQNPTRALAANRLLAAMHALSKCFAACDVAVRQGIQTALHANPSCCLPRSNLANARQSCLALCRQERIQLLLCEVPEQILVVIPYGQILL